MVLAYCKTILRSEHAKQIKTKPTMHRLIPALLWSGLSSESLLGPLNSSAKELGLRSWTISIISITMVPRSLQPWFRLVYPNKQSTHQKEASSMTQETAALTQGRAVATASADHHGWTSPLGALYKTWWETTQDLYFPSAWWKLVLQEIRDDTE